LFDFGKYIGSRHDDPAAQQDKRGAAQLAEQPRFRTSGVGHVAAEPFASRKPLSE
jgi:hypothetical protein